MFIYKAAAYIKSKELGSSALYRRSIRRTLLLQEALEPYYIH